MDEPALPRTARGASVEALSREDLDLFSIEELDERIQGLEGEIERVRGARKKKLAGRAAADALFGQPPE